MDCKGVADVNILLLFCFCVCVCFVLFCLFYIYCCFRVYGRTAVDVLYWVLNCIMCYFISFEQFLCGGHCF